MIIEDDVKLDFKDVLIRPKRSTLSSRKEVNLNRTFKFKHSKFEWSGVPIMAANMDGVGTFHMAENLNVFNMFTCLVKSYDLESYINSQKLFDGFYSNFAISTGTSDADWGKLLQILNVFTEMQFICIDVANGYNENFGDFVSKVRDRFPDKTIIAGNVVTADMTQELILRGADIVKVGIGPGSVCTTRLQTGVGYPQFSAIIECADAAHGLGGHIIADGGCTCPGDVAKAFGAGADFVMLGGMLAGHDEGGGEIVREYIDVNKYFIAGTDRQGVPDYQPVIEHRDYVKFYGMSSDTAMNKHYGGVANYRSSEGRTVVVPHRGLVKNTVLDLLGGLRSTCTYVGAESLKQLSKCTTFIRVNRQINDVFVK